MANKMGVVRVPEDMPIRTEWSAADTLKQTARRVLRIATAINALQCEGLLEKDHADDMARRVTITINPHY